MLAQYIITFLSTILYLITLAIISAYYQNDLFDVFHRIFAMPSLCFVIIISLISTNFLDLAILRWSDFKYRIEVNKCL